jgi:NADH pyrophosphatase NudC (nudix superfamily)
MNKEHNLNNADNQQLNISGVMPRFCFICGNKLMEVGLGWLQCESEQCGEVYFPFIDKNNNQCLMHQRTPFSPIN